MTIHMKKTSKSLIMCTTPLQMVIAEKIIDLKYNQNFDLLLISHTSNKKYQYYFNRLSKKCDQSLVYTLKKSRLGLLDFIWMFKKSKLAKNYDEVYLASIDSSYFSYVVSQQSNPLIFTFDDGTGNINNESIYYIPPKSTYLKTTALKLLRIKYTISRFKKLSVLHYSIYKDIPNIVKNTQFINLLNSSYKSIENKYSSEGIVIRILLGQPLEEISPHFLDFEYKNIIEKFNIDYYFEHPREKKCLKDSLTVIQTNLIFEDYISKILQENPNLKVEVYSFISSAAVNIAYLDRVKINIIYDSILQEKFESFYKLLNDYFNVNTVYP